MAKKALGSKAPKAVRAQRVKLSAAESLKRMQEFSQRKEAIIAAVRKGKNRHVST
jgi:hypothetical protein